MTKYLIISIGMLFCNVSRPQAQTLQTVTTSGNSTGNAIRLSGEGNIGSSGGGELVLGLLTTPMTNDTRNFIGWKSNLNTITDGLAGTLLLQGRSDIANVPIDFATGQGTPQLRMRIGGNGNVGIGCNIPTERLSIGELLSIGYTPIISLNELSNNGNNSMGIDFKFGGSLGFPWGATGRLEVARQGSTSNFDMVFHTATSGVLSEKMRILNNGNVGIGNSTPNANAKLDVNGNIFTSGKIAIGITDMTKINPYSLAVNGTAIFTKAIVKSTSSWPDYVFTPTYKLPKLDTLEQFIKLNGHLPEVPKAEEVEKNGIDLGSNQALLLKKIEELTLIAIEQNKKIEQQSKKISELEKKLE